MQAQNILQIQAVQEMVKKLNRLMYEEVWDLQALEQRMREAVLALGAMLMGEAIAKLDTEVRPSRCASCGGKLHHRKRSRTLATLVGQVRFQRSRGSCPKCGTVVYGVDRELGITSHQGRSGGMEALHALCAASWGYVRSAEVVSRMTGIPTNAMAVHRTVARAETATTATTATTTGQPTVSACPVTVRPILVDADGVLIHRRPQSPSARETPRWMEGKVICVWSANARVSRDRRRILDKRYYATFAAVDQIAPQVYREVFQRASSRVPAQQVVVRGDGGEWIRTLSHEWFAQGRLLLDAYHLRKKIRTRLREALLPIDPARTTDSQRLYHTLIAGKWQTATTILTRIQRQTTRLRNPEALRQLKGYLSRHQEGMWYPQARAEGIDIGTGAIEKGGDLVICRRFKLRGMRWSRPGAEAVLRYRLLVLNDDWEAYWQQRRTA